MKTGGQLVLLTMVFPGQVIYACRWLRQRGGVLLEIAEGANKQLLEVQKYVR